MHDCPECGLAHEPPVTDPPAAEPAVIVEQGPNEHDVEIAQIKADASVEREKIWTEQRGLELETEVGELRGELRGMREVLDRVTPPEPDPEPAPVVVPVPEPAPAPGPEPAAPVPESGPAPAKKKSGGFWP